MLCTSFILDILTLLFLVLFGSVETLNIYNAEMEVHETAFIAFMLIKTF